MYKNNKYKYYNIYKKRYDINKYTKYNKFIDLFDYYLHKKVINLVILDDLYRNISKYGKRIPSFKLVIVCIHCNSIINKYISSYKNKNCKNKYCRSECTLCSYKKITYRCNCPIT
ncbi:hypothetical protein [Alphaentomopoxvirus acuprea]|uniref:Uncharacterized protein n=1 Tax=Alphaentomopoxvirus acuprea TaxID=62099 RepID=W6JIT2_9POXV|nr:hypothetical protein BA82_gp118 [Anomala cuprea entomopoxvirus]BAO49478.1 hypothetical protein [Anomala cuprea entomopoxvirus]